MTSVNQIGIGLPAPTPVKEVSATRRLASPALWSLGGFSAAQVIRFASSLVLTRYLLPEDYGVMAVASAISVGVVLFSDLGTYLFLVQHKQAEDPRYFNTAWTIGAVRGIGLWGLTILAGWPISLWYHSPILIWLVPALGFNLVLAGLNSTSIPLLTRRIKPARVVMLNISTAFIGAALSVFWIVYVRADVWGLVIGNVASSIAMLALSHCILPGHRNYYYWDSEVAAELFRMSKWILPSTVVTFFADQSDRLLVAALAGMHEVGLYHLAAQLCQLPMQLLGTLSSNLLFPFFSEHIRNGSGADASVQRVRRLYLGLGTATTIGLLALGPIIAKLLFGQRFGDAGWMIQVLALGVAFRSAGTIGAEYLKALGKFRTHAVTNATKVPIILAATPILASFFGMPGLLAGLVLADGLRYAAIAYSLWSQRVPGLRDDVIAFSIIASASIAVLSIH